MLVLDVTVEVLLAGNVEVDVVLRVGEPLLRVMEEVLVDIFIGVVVVGLGVLCRRRSATELPIKTRITPAKITKTIRKLAKRGKNHDIFQLPRPSLLIDEDDSFIGMQLFFEFMTQL